MREEFIIAVIAFLLVIAILLIGPILAIVALVRTSRIKQLASELEQLATEVRQLREQLLARTTTPRERSAGELPVGDIVSSAVAAGAEFAPIEAVVVDTASASPATQAPTPSSPVRPRDALAKASSGVARAAATATAQVDGRSLELFIGRKALGWVAVVVLLFGTVFFLRYAYENQWIGPLGRVSIGILAGVSLIAGGWRYERQGWRSFSRMVTSAGVLILYVATYSAFGFYRLVPQQIAGVLLFVVVAESALLALAYNSWGVALMALVGGLLTPILMHSDHDQYVSLFTYLAILNAGSLALLTRRAWHAIGTVALLGTQGLYWLWYAENYHPEKLAWAAGFQVTLFALHWGHGLASAAWRRPSTALEEILRSSVNATAIFAALFVLLDERHHAWLGAVAVCLAAVESFGARILLLRTEVSQARLLTAVAIAVGFIALAFPLQANSHWVAVGWAAQAAMLGWFGLRIESLALRGMAFVLALLAGLRIVIFNAPWQGRLPFYPLWNDFATPSLVVVLLLASALFLSRHRLARANRVDRLAAGLMVVGCVLLTWFVLSFDVYQYFRSLEQTSILAFDWRRIAQMSLSASWALFASAVLAIGFRARLSVLRWSALGLYAVTVLKVFLVDMAGLDQIYRIVAFLLLAGLLGGAAWAYQRLAVRDGEEGGK